MKTKWANIENTIKRDLQDIYNHVKNLAPQNSKYVSVDNGKFVNYIYVDGKRTYTNTNTLYSSVKIKERASGSGKNMTSVVYVDSADVPYYEKAVLNPNIRYAKHYGRSEYGSRRYSNSVEMIKPNRNYLYYLGAKNYINSTIKKYNGRTYKISDSIEVFK